MAAAAAAAPRARHVSAAVTAGRQGGESLGHGGYELLLVSASFALSATTRKANLGAGDPRRQLTALAGELAQLAHSGIAEAVGLAFVDGPRAPSRPGRRPGRRPAPATGTPSAPGGSGGGEEFALAGRLQPGLGNFTAAWSASRWALSWL